MAAAARAEARKKAILARGTDRLAKLTTSARGDDGGILDPRPHVSVPSTQGFLGDENSVMPTPQDPFSTQTKTTATRIGSTSSVTGGSSLFDTLSASSTAASPLSNPSAWLPEHQQQFMQALLHASAAGGASLPGLSSPIGDPTSLLDPSAPLIDNPFAALMGLPGVASGAGGGIGAFPPGMKFPPAMQPPPTQEPRPKTTLQKALPLLHLVAVWCLLAYFVLFVEPKAYARAQAPVLGAEGGSLKWDADFLWRRWVELGQKPTLSKGLNSFRVQVVPFFWAFTTLEIVLNSMRFFAGFDAVQPPSIVALALPHLPPPFPSIIINSLKYLQMGLLFLDDLSGIVVGIGFIIYFSGWFVGSS